MFIRIAVILCFSALVGSFDAAADILRCQVKSLPPGYQERLVDIVVPNKEDYRYELSLVDAHTKDVRQLPSGMTPWPLQKALGTIEIRTRVFDGEYGKTERSRLLAFGPYSKDDLIAIIVREGTNGMVPGMIWVDLTSARKTISMADTTHLVGRLTIYEGTCE